MMLHIYRWNDYVLNGFVNIRYIRLWINMVLNCCRTGCCLCLGEGGNVRVSVLTLALVWRCWTHLRAAASALQQYYLACSHHHSPSMSPFCPWLPASPAQFDQRRSSDRTRIFSSTFWLLLSRLARVEEELARFYSECRSWCTLYPAPLLRLLYPARSSVLSRVL